MLSPIVSRQHKTVYMYKDHRLRHRYQRKCDKSSHKSTQKHLNQHPSTNYQDFIKTLDYNDNDQWVFSDNKIKNCQPLDASPCIGVNKPPIHRKDASWKKNLPPKSEEDCKNEIHGDEPFIFGNLNEKRSSRTYSAKQGCRSNRPGKIEFQNSVDFGRQVTSVFDKRKKQKSYNLSVELAKRGEQPMTPMVKALTLQKYCPEEKKPIPSGKVKMNYPPKPPMVKLQTQRKSIPSKIPKNQPKPKPKVFLEVANKMRQNIDGWEIDNPSFNQFEDFHEAAQPDDFHDVRVSEVRTPSTINNYSRY